MHHVLSDIQASFRTQAGALLRKNAAFQRRNRRSNCCITVTPVLFIMLLFVIQKLVNSAFDTPETNVSAPAPMSSRKLAMPTRWCNPVTALYVCGSDAVLQLARPSSVSHWCGRCAVRLRVRAMLRQQCERLQRGKELQQSSLQQIPCCMPSWWSQWTQRASSCSRCCTSDPWSSALFAWPVSSREHIDGDCATLQVCRDATPEAPCYPGTYTGDCKTYNKSNCGLQYSDQQNAAYCAIDTPSTWPPLLQVCRNGWQNLFASLQMCEYGGKGDHVPHHL